MRRTQQLAFWGLALCPLAYLFARWNTLPSKVPVHFNIKGEVDRVGNKTELLWLLLFLIGLNIATFYLVTYSANRGPGKKDVQSNKNNIHKLAFAISIFLTAITLFVIYSVDKAAKGNIAKGDFVLSAVGLLYCILGNYMHNIKPNYTVGFRLSTTLKDEENWKKTHRLAGKLWFWGGLLIALFCALLPSKASFIFFAIATFILVTVPVIYSIKQDTNKKSLTGKNN